MARGTQLLELIAQLRAETGRTQNVAVGVDEKENLKRMLQRVQETLYDDNAWEHLNINRKITLAQGQRYYDLPSDLNFDKISNVKLKYGGNFVDFPRGIEFNDYSTYDSMSDEQSSPARKWDIRYTGSGEQLEVWPIPSSNGDEIHIFGTLALPALVQESDRAVLDDIMIVLYAAAEILSRQKSPDAQAKLELGNKRKLKLLGNASTGKPPVQIGLGGKTRDISNRTTVIVR